MTFKDLENWQKNLVVKGLNDDENIYIKYTKDDIIASFKQENQKLKKQQKEFIEYLENEIKYWEEQEQQWIKLGFMKFGGEANNKIIFKKVLSKYKEITGVNGD